MLACRARLSVGGGGWGEPRAAGAVNSIQGAVGRVVCKGACAGPSSQTRTRTPLLTGTSKPLTYPRSTFIEGELRVFIFSRFD